MVCGGRCAEAIIRKRKGGLNWLPCRGHRPPQTIQRYVCAGFPGPLRAACKGAFGPGDMGWAIVGRLTSQSNRSEAKIPPRQLKVRRYRATRTEYSLPRRGPENIRPPVSLWAEAQPTPKRERLAAPFGGPPFCLIFRGCGGIMGVGGDFCEKIF